MDDKRPSVRDGPLPVSGSNHSMCESIRFSIVILCA